MENTTTMQRAKEWLDHRYDIPELNINSDIKEIVAMTDKLEDNITSIQLSETASPEVVSYGMGQHKLARSIVDSLKETDHYNSFALGFYCALTVKLEEVIIKNQQYECFKDIIDNLIKNDKDIEFIVNAFAASGTISTVEVLNMNEKKKENVFNTLENTGFIVSHRPLKPDFYSLTKNGMRYLNKWR